MLLSLSGHRLHMLETLNIVVQRLTADTPGLLAIVWIVSVMSALLFLLDLRLAGRIRSATKGFGAFVPRDRYASRKSPRLTRPGGS